jgi:hypothetical protein
MQRLDLVWQARTYVNQAKATISVRKKLKLLGMAQRLLHISVENSAGLVFITARDAQIFARRRPRV